MSLVDVVAVIEFIAAAVSIARAICIDDSDEVSYLKRLEELVKQTQDDLEDIRKDIDKHSADIKNLVTAGKAIDIRSRLEKHYTPDEKLELLIKLLFLLKARAPNVVFAIVVKYPRAKKAGTLGVAGSTSEKIEDLVTRVDSFYNALQYIKKEKTAFVNVRIRGRFDLKVETSCSALVYSIATAVCGLSRNAQFENRVTCPIQPEGTKTFVLLKPTAYNYKESEYDKLRRIYIIGDTRSGKSTVGNAILQQNAFHVSKGLTGTMNIERGERVEEWNAELWRTDIFDTPGLNDADHLDVWYEAAIEDHIVRMQRASTFVMTVSISEGIKGNTHATLDSYRRLFGQSMASMLILILTVNESADYDDLEEYKEENQTKWIQFDDRLNHDHVYCVSLHDLREGSESASHKHLEKIFEQCRGMPIRLIQSLQEKRNELKDAMVEKRRDVQERVQGLVNEGWQLYEHLSEAYANSPYTKLTFDADGLFDGFVMKKTSLSRKLIAMGTLGLWNRIQKVAIEVQCLGKRAAHVWTDFMEKNISRRKQPSMMTDLGDLVHREGLAVVVQDLGTYHVFTLRVQRFAVIILHPTSYARSELIELLQELADGQAREFQPEVIEELMKNVAVPIRVTASLGKNWRRKNQNS